RPSGALVSQRHGSRRAAASDCNGVLVSLLLGLHAAKVYLCVSKDSSMSRLPATAVLRLACWCLCLLFVAGAGNPSPGAAAPRAVASSVFALPLSAIDDLLWPTSTPEAEPG